METVELQCGGCGQVMAVSVEHLGMQVHCPHCQQVVQVPASSGKRPPSEGEIRVPSQDDESVLSPARSDDLFNDAPPTRLQFSAEPKLPPTKTSAEAFTPEPAAKTPVGDVPVDEVASFQPRYKPPKESMLVPILLIFLIPYAIATTCFIAWLIYSQNQNRFDPLERLPDPAPGEGGPRQIQHDLKLPPHLQTVLGEPLKIGDLEVTPVNVELTREGDLKLSLKMENVGEKVEFKPVADAFCRVNDEYLVGKPYTYLEPASHEPKERLYGGYLDWLRGPPGEEEPFDGIIKPGETMLTVLTTRDKDRKKVQPLLKNPQKLLWRVQVRRGLVNVRGQLKSATAVVGVQFQTAAIQKPRKL